MSCFKTLLAEVEHLLDSGPDSGPDAEAAVRVLEKIGGSGVTPEMLANGRIYSETLPKGREPGFTPGRRHLHFLWDAFDRCPLSLIVEFSFLFRRMLAERLFERVGAAFVAEEQVRFNFGQFLRLGDNVFFNRGVFLDSKGGIELGESVALAEDVRIFTHGHSEASHMERTYAPVRVGDFAKIYAGATIMPGVTIGQEAIVAAGATVTRDVPPGMVVAGLPAKVLRERQSGGRHGHDLDHIWLF